MAHWKKMLLLVGLVLLVVCGIKAMMFWQRASAGFQNAKQVITRDFARKVSQVRAGDQINLEHIELLRELVRATQDTETSFFGVVLSGCVGWQAIEDEHITQQEKEAIHSVIDILRKNNGKVGFFQMITFVRNHPDVYQLIEELAEKSRQRRNEQRVKSKSG